MRKKTFPIFLIGLFTVLIVTSILGSIILLSNTDSSTKVNSYSESSIIVSKEDNKLNIDKKIDIKNEAPAKSDKLSLKGELKKENPALTNLDNERIENVNASGNNQSTDIAITSIGISPATNQKVGDKINTIFFIQNMGNVSTNISWRYSIINPDGSGGAGGSACPVGSNPCIELKPGESVSKKFSFEVSSPGKHTIKVYVDSDTPDNNPINNQASISFVVKDKTQCPADFNKDGEVDGTDLANLLGNWGPVNNESVELDIYKDGVIDNIDLIVLDSAWGQCNIEKATDIAITSIGISPATNQKVGDAINVDIVAKNLGNVTANISWSYSIMRPDNSGLGGNSACPVGGSPCIELKPGEFKTFQTIAFIPSIPGKYTINTHVDSDTADNNLINNQASISFIVEENTTSALISTNELEY